MTDRPEEEPKDDVLRVLALLAQTGTARGERPSKAEMKALASGKLSQDRRLEVESHIAHDPGAFSIFVALARAAASLPDRRRTALRWLQLSPGRVTALAACVLAVVGAALILHKPQSGASGQRVSIARTSDVSSSSAPVRDWQRRAFRYGFENPSVLERVVTSSGDAFAGDCAGNDCGNEMDALIDLGIAFGRLREECTAAPSFTDPLPEAGEVKTDLERIAARVQDPSWRSRADQVARSLRRPAREPCGLVIGAARAAGATFR